MFTRGYTVNDGSMAKLIRLLYHPITIPSSRLCCRLQPCNDLMSWPRAKCLLYNSVSYIIYHISEYTCIHIYIYVCLYIYMNMSIHFIHCWSLICYPGWHLLILRWHQLHRIRQRPQQRADHIVAPRGLGTPGARGCNGGRFHQEKCGNMRKNEEMLGNIVTL
jgi:hypothetical protein